ncbi:uncharacterized protein LOC116420353 [Sarcophilus harrisii]|uniref:uncharacterized protein LOC116420353 n=1 Tax=Sarcophilus harrisii TaxID=9305 RepID=UPI001301B5AA|nr:uncharacterized protein LOC116420353 [Sarcophilus harrisii]
MSPEDEEATASPGGQSGRPLGLSLLNAFPGPGRGTNTVGVLPSGHETSLQRHASRSESPPAPRRQTVGEESEAEDAALGDFLQSFLRPGHTCRGTCAARGAPLPGPAPGSPASPRRADGTWPEIGAGLGRSGVRAPLRGGGSGAARPSTCSSPPTERSLRSGQRIEGTPSAPHLLPRLVPPDLPFISKNCPRRRSRDASVPGLGPRHRERRDEVRTAPRALGSRPRASGRAGGPEPQPSRSASANSNPRDSGNGIGCGGNSLLLSQLFSPKQLPSDMKDEATNSLSSRDLFGSQHKSEVCIKEEFWRIGAIR